ncbi:MAG: hypothetical protein WCK57_11840 [Verrucomicrobiae bacterium]
MRLTPETARLHQWQSSSVKGTSAWLSITSNNSISGTSKSPALACWEP